MRSRPSLKHTIPCLLVILAVSVPMHAQAGVFEALKAAANMIFSSNNAPPEGATLQQPVVAADFDVERDLIEKIAPSVAFAHRNIFTQSLRTNIVAEALKKDAVNTETHTDLQMVYTEDGLKIQFLYDEVAVKNPALLIKDMAVLALMTNSAGAFTGFFRFDQDLAFKQQFQSPHSVAELLADAQSGSPSALARLERTQVKVLKSLQLDPGFAQKINADQYLKELLEAKEKELPAFESKAQDYQRKQQKALDKWKSDTHTLDKYEAMNDKLDDLIMKNDRKGVAAMLRAYLPWAVMEPVEAKAWKTWLEAIEHPDLSNTTVAFRGISYDTDKIQRRETPQGEIFGFMSPVLTKNQGSYTRRLRSLSTNREKNGDEGFAANGSKLRTVKITDQMSAHARNPVASSFMSFTYDPEVAHGFAGQNINKTIKGQTVSVPYGGLLVVKMDSRRLVPNIASMYGEEIELLAPLIIFPDEVVAYKEGQLQGTEYADLLKDVSDKTGIDFTNWKETQAGETNEKLVNIYKRDGFKFLESLMPSEASGPGLCSKALL